MSYVQSKKKFQPFHYLLITLQFLANTSGQCLNRHNSVSKPAKYLKKLNPKLHSHLIFAINIVGYSDTENREIGYVIISIHTPDFRFLFLCFSLCQTYIGSILCAVNPYYVIEGLYDKSVMEMYREKHIGELPPHVFAIANECYYSMWKKGESQCILIRYISIRKSII